MRERMSKRDANALSVRVELQADCFAGVWANHANQESGGTLIDDKDVEQALAAATAIGDDRLQQQAQGRVVPDSFTHGTSAQRVRWFSIGPEVGRQQELRYVPGAAALAAARWLARLTRALPSRPSERNALRRSER